MRVLTAEQMRDLDRQTIADVGVSGVVLMENAGRGAAFFLAAEYASLKAQPLLIVCGKGNNGGDGYVMARHLLNWGWQVRTLVLSIRDQVTGDAGVNLQALIRQGGEVAFAPDTPKVLAFLQQQRPVLVVDALFGTGLQSAVRGHYRQAIDWINSFSGPVVAVDIPSGVDASTGRVLGCSVAADMTLTFAAPKLGHLLHPGAILRGRLEIIDIGIPPHLQPVSDDHFSWFQSEDARNLLPSRPLTAHKGTFGHLLLLAGSSGKSGAAVLAAEAGLRSGAGLVTLATPQSQQIIVASRLTEVMTAGLPDVDGGLSLAAIQPLIDMLPGRQALAIGPGLGQAAETIELVRRLLVRIELPLVIDADGLNALAGDLAPLTRRSGPIAVLTPHPGEMARLCGLTVEEVEADRLELARKFSRQFQVVLVLKGAPTLVAAPDGTLSVNGSGNPLLASGGSGDVLTGLIGGFLAQGLDPVVAARLGVFLHGHAADRLALRLGAAGVFAGELGREIPAARKSLLKRG